MPSSSQAVSWEISTGATLMIAEKASDMILGLPPLHPADNLPGEDESLLGNA